MWFVIGIEAGVILGLAATLVFAQSITGVPMPFKDLIQLLAEYPSPAPINWFATVSVPSEPAALTPAEMAAKVHDYMGYAAIAGAAAFGLIGRILDDIFHTRW